MVAAKAIGTIYLFVSHDCQLVLNNYFYITPLIENLISVPVMDNKGFTFVFGSSRCLIQKNDRVICKRQVVNNLYKLNINENR